MELEHISPHIIEAVEGRLGNPFAAWSLLDPREVILACYEVVHKTIGTPDLPRRFTTNEAERP
jgi:hypothetical protein